MGGPLDTALASANDDVNPRLTRGLWLSATLIEWWTCNGGANQQWQAVNGQLVNPSSGKCLDDPAFNTTNGTQLVLWTCNGGSNQQWHLP